MTPTRRPQGLRRATALAVLSFACAACSGALGGDAAPFDALANTRDGGAPGDSGGSGTVVINEVAAAGAPSDWFELFNPSARQAARVTA